MATSAFRDGLQTWFADVARDLPWRNTRDPWRVLVSETMLQQTQVSRVLPKYSAFVERFPTVETCAAAPASDVIRLWSGLGYNRRAIALHDAAGYVASQHGGVIPRTYDELLRLPGVGPYTARAVLVFAFEDHQAVVDTNVARVVARAIAGQPVGRALVQQLADSLVPEDAAWPWNQAMLDLGATVCTKRAPKCNTCPVSDACKWKREGGADPTIGSALTPSKQSTFIGSDREGRGRLVAALGMGPVAREDAACVMGWATDAERSDRVIRTLVTERLIIEVEGELRLPGAELVGSLRFTPVAK